MSSSNYSKEVGNYNTNSNNLRCKNIATENKEKPKQSSYSVNHPMAGSYLSSGLLKNEYSSPTAKLNTLADKRALIETYDIQSKNNDTSSLNNSNLIEKTQQVSNFS